MEKSEYRISAYDMIYFVSCAIKGETPEKDRLDRVNLKSLFEVCQKHILTACVAYSLESAGIQDHDFTQAKEKAIRKNILLDAERAKILKRLEAEKIWYMPLKGVILKDWYPKLGMRQMSDNDILCDGNYRARIKDIMLEIGFTCDHYGIGNDDAYFKKPVYNFEMHNELFHAASIGKLNEYYSDVKEKLIKDEGNAYGYHFRIEDFYIYITAHEYKHFSSGGTGVRSLVDTYVFLHKFSNAMDWDYINAELAKLEIADYEKMNRELAMNVFNEQKLSEKEQQLLEYYIFSGIYGTLDNSFKNYMDEKAQGSKKNYICQRVFPPLEHYKVWFPWAYKHKILIPVAWLYRPVKGLLFQRKKLIAELKYLKKS